TSDVWNNAPFYHLFVLSAEDVASCRLWIPQATDMCATSQQRHLIEIKIETAGADTRRPQGLRSRRRWDGCLTTNNTNWRIRFMRLCARSVLIAWWRSLTPEPYSRSGLQRL